MRQAIHIFRKDVRALRFHIAVVLALLALFTIQTCRYSQEPFMSHNDMLVAVLTLIVAWGVLVASLIYNERLVGDRQFWCTRPYSWTSLLMAKVLFLVAFVTAPLLVAQAVIAQCLGFSLISALPRLLWNQLLVAAAIVLPLVALAAIARGMGQMMVFLLSLAVVWFGITIAFTGVEGPEQWGAYDWIRRWPSIFLLATAAGTAILWQYRRRDTARSRIAMLAGFALAALPLTILPWNTAFAIQSRLINSGDPYRDIHLRFDSARVWLASINPTRFGLASDSVHIDFPVALEGAPQGMEILSDGVSMALEEQNGSIWRSSENRPWGLLLTSEQVPTLGFDLKGPIYRRIRNQPVRLILTAHLMIASPQRSVTIPYDTAPRTVNGANRCWAVQEEVGTDNSSQLLCTSLFAEPDLLTAQFGSATRTRFRRDISSYAPFSTMPHLDPLVNDIAMDKDKGPATITVSKPVALIKRDLTIENIRLSDFEHSRVR